MFSIFAARMFEQRVLQAYREKVAQERQLQLLRELEEEDKNSKEKEAKKQTQNQKKKEKKRCVLLWYTTLISLPYPVTVCRSLRRRRSAQLRRPRRQPRNQH